MLKLVAAPNALKGSLSPFAAAAAIAAGARRATPDLQVVELGIADGGDGTAEVICRARGGSFREVAALDPLGRARTARYGWLDDGTAVIDVATASGLALLAPAERNALGATSYGTGELLRAALDASAKRIVLGVGGSASVDGGSGILEALGARLLDAEGKTLPRGGGALGRLSRIDLSGLSPRAREVPIDIACDVDSALLGEHGAARLFGPQKGADAAGVETLESALAHFAAIVARDCGRDASSVTSGGAAGGVAAGLYGVLGARLLPGVDLVLDAVGFDEALVGASLCITAEGLLDRQSLRNKGPFGVAKRGAARGVPVVALGGGIAGDVTDADFPAFAGMFSICSRPMTLEQAMRDAAPLLEAAAERVVRLFARARSSERAQQRDD
ncbi:MAG TPA: glycerate kinase [Polyangiaceae bacterium]|nr:glycerate kinase [Polyangiaceae bacterium]